LRIETFSGHEDRWFCKKSVILVIWRKCAMVEKKLVALGLICVVLCVAVVGAVVVVNQKDCELQMKADQISGIEDERLSLEDQVATLQS
jgi:hypothetical protein